MKTMLIGLAMFAIPERLGELLWYGSLLTHPVFFFGGIWGCFNMWIAVKVMP